MWRERKLAKAVASVNLSINGLINAGKGGKGGLGGEGGTIAGQLKPSGSMYSIRSSLDSFYGNWDAVDDDDDNDIGSDAAAAGSSGGRSRPGSLARHNSSGSAASVLGRKSSVHLRQQHSVQQSLLGGVSEAEEV